jgi:hypothetical protein
VQTVCNLRTRRFPHPATSSRAQLKMITVEIATNRTRLRLSARREGFGELGQQAQKAKMLVTCGTTNSNAPPQTDHQLSAPAG